MKEIDNLKLYKRCLIVVDMVNGFVNEGVLHDEKIRQVVPNQLKLIKEAKANNDLIIFIKDSHELNSVEHNRFGTIKHCINGTTEAELIDEFKKYEGLDNVLVFKKNCTSFREAPGFIDTIQASSNIKEFDICGCCTDICVTNGVLGLANYLDENNRKHTINVYLDAVATYNEEERSDYVEASKILLKQQGINLVNTTRKDR